MRRIWLFPSLVLAGLLSLIGANGCASHSSAKPAPPTPKAWTIRGKIDLPDGRPATGSKVSFVAADGQKFAATVLDAAYTIEGLAPGVYTVEAMSEDHLHSVAITGFDPASTGGALDLVLSQGPPQFEAPQEDPAGVPVSQGQGQLPRQ